MVSDVNSKNFEQTVLKSSLPVVVDYWAPWCVAPNSAVTKTANSADPAGSIKKNDEILAYDGKKVVSATVLDSRTAISGGHCKKIRTNTGREIEVTDDHLFYTDRGWKEAAKLKAEDRVAVHPVFLSAPPKEKAHHTDILLETDIKRRSDKKMRIDQHMKQLIALNLLPLSSNNPKVPVLARLAGALFSDGSLYRQAANNYSVADFIVGEEEDAKDLYKDLEEIGFSATITKRKNTFKINGRLLTITSRRVRVNSTSFWLLMNALGVPNGRKTDIEYSVPSWILTASKSVQREFLAGYLGGDGPSITMKVVSRGKRGSYNGLGINNIELYKSETALKSGTALANQLARLLRAQGVGIARVFVDAERFKRKYGGYSRSIHIVISSSFESGIAMAAVGYAYCHSKQMKAGYVGAFLKSRIKQRKAWRSKYTQAKELFSKGISIKNVSTSLQLNYTTVFNWLRKGVKPTINYTFERYDDWLRNSTRDLNGGLVWERVASVEDVYLHAVQSLTIDKYSNFIANGFLVHNCGPCRVYGPIIEEVSKEYAGKANFFKLNVDENEDIAAKYSIQSIPTTLLFVKGNVKAMSVGAIPKAEFKKWLDSNL